MTYYEFMENEITALRAEVKTITEENSELIKDLAECEHNLKDAEERCNVKDAYIDELRMKLESMVARNEELKHCNAFYKGATAGGTVLKVENENLRRDNKRLNDLWNEMNGKLATYEAELNEYRGVIGCDPRGFKIELRKLEKELAEANERNHNQFETIKKLKCVLNEYKVVCGDNPEAMKTYILENDERITKLRNDNKLLEMGMMDATTNMNIVAENKRLREQNAKYKIAIHTIEQMLNCKFDI